MSPDIVSFLAGEPLSSSENHDPLIRTTYERLSKATKDEQLRAELTCDEVLDVLEKEGYSGIPRKEFVAGIQPVIQ
ncbi:hypothetical protein ABFA07_022792 [Porites harrisoni]